MTLELTIPITGILLYGYDFAVVILSLLFILTLIYYESNNKNLKAPKFDVTIVMFIILMVVAFVGDGFLALSSSQSVTFCHGSCIYWEHHYVHPINWAIGIVDLISSLVHITWV